MRDKTKGAAWIARLENALGEELILKNEFKGLDPASAIIKAGAWLDIPKVPNFEDTQKVIGKANSGREHATAMFPIHAWQHAYTSYRCYVRIYSYSEHFETVKVCAKAAMKKVLKIEDDAFYKSIERARG